MERIYFLALTLSFVTAKAGKCWYFKWIQDIKKKKTGGTYAGEFCYSFDHWKSNSVKLFISTHKHLYDPRYDFPQGYKITKTGVTTSS